MINFIQIHQERKKWFFIDNHIWGIHYKVLCSPGIQLPFFLGVNENQIHLLKIYASEDWETFPQVTWLHTYHILLLLYDLYFGFPGSSAGEESGCKAGDPSLIPGSGRSPEEEIGYPLQCFCLENPHGQRSLVSYSPWGCKEWDMTEHVRC